MEELKRELKTAFPAIDFDREKALVSDGLLDSLSIVNIIELLEDRFGVTAPTEYIQPVYFESVEAMWELVRELRK